MGRGQTGNDIYGVKSGWKLEQWSGETAETGFRHSDYYHKYFHGYTELRREKPDGKYIIERYYTADWYRQDCTDARWVLQKILLLGLALLSALGYFWLMSRPDLKGNTSRAVAVPGLASVVFLILLAASAVGYMSAKRKMTWWEHHISTARIRRYTILSGGMMMCTGIVALLQSVVLGEYSEAELGLAFGILMIGCIPLLMYCLEKKMHYTTEPNKVELPHGDKHLIS